MEYTVEKLEHIIKHIQTELEGVYTCKMKKESDGVFWSSRGVIITLKTGQRTEWILSLHKETGEFAFEFLLLAERLRKEEEAKKEIMTIYLFLLQTIRDYFQKDPEIRMKSLFEAVSFSNDAGEQIKGLFAHQHMQNTVKWNRI